MLKEHKQAYLFQLRNRYKSARRAEKKTILDEFTKTTGYDRKHAGKLLRGKYQYVTKHRLREQYKTLNLVLLKKQIDEILKRLQRTQVR